MKESIEELKKKKWKVVESNGILCYGCDLLEYKNCMEICNFICKSKSNHVIVREVK